MIHYKPHLTNSFLGLMSDEQRDSDQKRYGFLALTFWFLLVSSSSFLSLSNAEMNGTFKCRLPATCHALVGYKVRETTTLGAVQTLFSIKNLRSILGANNLPLSTPSDAPALEYHTIRIPIPCVCANGTGVSNRVPEYTVVRDDTLYGIASGLFGGLVQYQRIADLNKISNNRLIEVGQKLWIPLPCSCDKVDGQDVVHYAHVVEPGSSVGKIAAQFGTDNATLLNLNGITGDSQLLAEYALDVPLKACNSSVRSDSLESPLLLANGSYVFTANNCVRCSCEASKDWTLSCEASQLRPSKWPNCPSTQCNGHAAEDLFLGNTTTGPCGQSSCAYAGFSYQSIFTTLLTNSTCPAPAPSNDAPTSHLSWINVSFQLAFLTLDLLQ